MSFGRFFIYITMLFMTFAVSAQSLTLTPFAYGAVRFGAKLTDVEAKLKARASPKKREFACDYVRFKQYSHISFMVEAGVITRADAEADIKNSAGINIGMPFKEFRRRYPKALIEPHKYNENGHYLTLKSADSRAALVFEESDGKVNAVRAGLYPAVDYVEHCL